MKYEKSGKILKDKKAKEEVEWLQKITLRQP